MDVTRTLSATDDDPASAHSAAQYLTIALDCARPLAPPVRLLLDTARVIIGRGSRRAWKRTTLGDGGNRESVLRIDLPDAWMSTLHARLVSDRAPGPASWTVEDHGSKNGTFVNGVRVQGASLRDGDVVELGNTLLVFRALSHSGPAADQAARPHAPSGVPRTLHPPWATGLTTLLRVARSTLPMLILGETGTGKDVIARAVHVASGRSGPFIPVNCGAIARTLIESELFGVRKGAFSGATEDRAGLVRAADGGTLLLDEIAELPEPSQVALLRVLQEREVLPVGATRAIPIDLRVIASTHADLAAQVADGRFRGDLYARLCGHVSRLPPLRARIEDVGLLVTELLPRLAGERASRLTFARAAGRALFAYTWPFNVRELEHALHRALAVAPDDELGLSHLPEPLRSGAPSGADTATSPGSVPPDEPEGVQAERDRIVAALQGCAGNQTHAARALGISRATLVNKLAIHRLPRPRKAR